MQAVEQYLRDLSDIRLSGAAVPETSYYPALANLLNEIGKILRPRVFCIINPRNEGAGIPDGGLFTRDQLQSDPTADMIKGILPARGALEVKGVGADLSAVAASEQVDRYCKRYGQVLVTNLREFALVALMTGSHPVVMERYSLVENEQDFRIALPHALAEEHGVRLEEHLKRVMLHAAPLTTPRDLAWILASYARDALSRVEHAHVPAVDQLRAALEETLGMRFEGERGEHFFRSTLVQTLFYGVFSAWVLWCKENPPGTTERFRWREAQWSLHVPVISALFEQLTMPGKLKPLGLEQLLEWAGQALNRVDRAAFFQNFEETHAVQYFYEPFLEAFDPELRKQLGVWYTPPEVVRYMVARVDTALREELGVADGLADPNVYVLDPAAGTGSYLVEVLRHIATSLRQKGDDALLGYHLKQAAIGRVAGFEILPAPFVISHLQLGLLLQNEGAPLKDDDTERAAMYLTNSLTGWEVPEKTQLRLLFPELQLERDAAERVKRDAPILVVIGNPPYNGFAGVAVTEERQLSNAYRTTEQAPAPQGQGLNDLYVRFFRMAERRIVEQTGRGIVCFVSNYSWLDGLSFTGMRERYLKVFDQITIDCLNGDKYKTGKLTPSGDPDPSIFSTDFNPEGIQVGTAIALLVRKELHSPAEAVRFRDLWGRGKRAQLAADAADESAIRYHDVEPPLRLGLPLVPSHVAEDYLFWPALTELFPWSSPGVQPSRDDLLIDIDREQLANRMRLYFDRSVSGEVMGHIASSSIQSTPRFDAVSVRTYLQSRGFLAQNVVRYCYRPFDLRWLYWEPETKLLDEKRSSYFRQISPGNVSLAAAQRHRHEFDPPFVSEWLISRHIDERGANVFPLQVTETNQPGQLAQHALDGVSDTHRNISGLAAGYLGCLNSEEDPSVLFFHVIAVLYSSGYKVENASALRQDWPRIPLPCSRALLSASAELGRGLAHLLSPEEAVPGVTAHASRSELRSVCTISRVGGGSLDPDAGDLALTVGWGHAGKGGAVMPGSGRVVKRDYTTDEREATGAGAAALGLTPELAFAHLGEMTYDVYLNDRAYWRNIPEGVWKYTIGGYQVIKKWLSYRERPLLGRPLQADEAQYVGEVARRIAAILLLEPALDANYQTVKENIFTWSTAGETAGSA
jgi:Type ISP C-terminal specificity domain/N-6 DNA Methylase